MSTPYSVHCIDEAATALLVQTLARAIRAFFSQNQRAHHAYPHLHLSLQGDLGAGKTTAVRYLLKELGYLGKVKSPTYSLCEEYILDLPNEALHIFHFDLYRMQSPQEWVEAGLLEYFTQYENPTLCIIEWPAKAESTLPTMDLSIILMHPNQQESELARTVAIEANTVKGEAILQSISSRSH